MFDEMWENLGKKKNNSLMKKVKRCQEKVQRLEIVGSHDVTIVISHTCFRVIFEATWDGY